MRTVIVEDEPIMIRSFLRLSKGIQDLEIVESFEMAEDAIEYVDSHSVELVFLDIELPRISGIECTRILRQNHPGILIVFLSAYDCYLREANVLGADDYLLKPYTTEIIEQTMEKMRLLVRRQRKDIYVQMFGMFTVTKGGVPVPLSGKGKEILALILAKRGKEISNEEIYSTIWEFREYSNVQMKVYYNALKRLRDILAKYGMSNMIYSTARGQMANTDIFDCDYYSWLDGNRGGKERFYGEFLSEYSWGESFLGDLIQNL